MGQDSPCMDLCLVHHTLPLPLVWVTLTMNAMCPVSLHFSVCDCCCLMPCHRTTLTHLLFSINHTVACFPAVVVTFPSHSALSMAFMFRELNFDHCLSSPQSQNCKLPQQEWYATAAKLLQSCPIVRPHRRQPTRLPHLWDSPGKNTGVGCHFLLQCIKVKSESEVAQLCLTLSDPMDCSPPGSSVHGIFQARVLEWGAIAFSGRNGMGVLKSVLQKVAGFVNPTHLLSTYCVAGAVPVLGIEQ